MQTNEHRAEFDASVTFSNGGGLQVQGFRLDIPGDDISEDELRALLVRHLGLLMTEQVEIDRLRIIREPHKGSRGGPSDGRQQAPTNERHYVELSHPITEDMVTYPGLPGPSITEHLSRQESILRYGPGVEFSIQRISMVGNTGTYLDSPYHRYAEGGDLASLPLAGLAELPAVVVRVTGSKERAIGVGAVAALEVADRAVLFHTGWDRHWGSEAYGSLAPFLTREASTWLVEHGALLVGIDSVNVDDTEDLARPAHSVLLGAGVPIVEHLTGLDELPVEGARFTAAPPAVAGLGTFPVRAYARLPGPLTSVQAATVEVGVGSAKAREREPQDQ